MNLAIDKLVPGMELADDVLNLNRGLLLGKGTVISLHHLRILKTWGVEQVRVAQDGADEDAPPADPVVSAEDLQEATERVDRRLRLVQGEAAALKQIRELAIGRRARQIVRDRATASNRHGAR